MPDGDDTDRWYLIRRWYLIAAFVPALLAEPGRISADTKTYLTVDPGRLLSSASSMWDPSVGAGTVPHQNIGYLFPLGPYHWLLDVVGVPSWIGQRLVWAILVFAASWGACRLGRLLGWSTTMAGVAGLAYGFSPYLLSYLARLSVILFPWAAMPWLIVLAMRLVRRPRWSTGAAFAGVIALVGSVNATSLVFAGLGPVVFVVADLVTRRTRVASTAVGIGKVGVLTLGVSAWWIVGLAIQGAHGLPILRFTETYRAISGASTPAEVLRGLGYWFFYGGDRLDHWIGPSSSYTNEGWLILLGFGVAMGSLLGLLISFRRRGTFVAMFAVGMVVSVGGAPVGSSTIYGSWFDEFATDSTIGGALRSTTRAMPLVTLALAAGFGALVDVTRRWLVGRRERWADARLAVLVGCSMLVLQFFPWFIGTMTTDSLLRDAEVPAHVGDLARHLDGAGDGRVLMIPGSDFAYPRAGGTIDPILPGILDRPVLYRELVPQGAEATAELLNAHERRLHDGWAEPEAWPTIARLLGATAVAAINDHQYERFRLARPGQLWPDLRRVLGEPDHVGPIVDDVTQIDLVDGITYTDPEAVTSFPAVAAWELDDGPGSAVRALPAGAPIVVDGDGEGLVDLAGAGLLDAGTIDDRLIVYRASLDDPGAPRDAILSGDVWWVVTDTNRAQGRRWSTIGSNLGPIEPAGVRIDLDPDPGDQRLDVFDDDLETDPDRRTVAEHRGDIALVRSSYTGSRIAYTPEDAPFMATDGDLATAWRTGVFDDARGLEFRLDLHDSSLADHVVLVQPVTGVVDRVITRVRITVRSADGDRSIDADLTDASRTPDGQRIELPDGPPFDRMTIEILDDNLGPLATYAGRPGVGFAEVRLPDVDDDRVVRLPIVGDEPAAGERLTYLMTRERIDAATQNRFAPERRLIRTFDVPEERSFELRAEVRLAPEADDALFATAVGLPDAPTADRRVRGTTTTWAAAAIDGDPATAWTTPIDATPGSSVVVPVTGAPVGELRFRFRTDERHSVPTTLTVADGERSVQLPVAAADLAPDGTVTLPWPDELTASPSSIAVVIDEIEPRTADEYFSGLPQVLPVGLSELDVIGADGASLVAERIDRDRPLATLGCRDDLITLDGAPVPVRLDGTVGDLLDGAEVAASTCDSATITLSGDEHRLETSVGAGTGLDVDRVVLDGRPTRDAAEPEPTAPDVRAERRSDTEWRIEIGPSTDAAWIVLEESWSPAWEARLDGEPLGEPLLVAGASNGWLVPAGDGSRTVELVWTPQRNVRIGIVISLLAAVAILGLLATSAWRRRPPVAIDDTESDTESDTAGAGDPPSGVDDPDLDGGPARSRILVAATFVVVGVVVAGPVPTLLGGLVAAMAHWRRWRWLVPAVVVVSVGITGSWVAAAETLRDYADSPDWPSQFAWTAPLVWTAVVAVVAAAALAGSSPGGTSAADQPSG